MRDAERKTIADAANRVRRISARAWVVLVLVTTAGMGATEAPSASLSIRVTVPARMNAGEPRDIAVTIGNGGATPVLVLPNMVRLRVEGIGAEYVPYPGPPIDPWGGAREMAPGATMTVEFRNASDRRGVWRLPPGNYRITALYEVPSDLTPLPSVANAGRIWRGRLESPPTPMVVNG